NAAADSGSPNVLIHGRIGAPQLFLGPKVHRVRDAPWRDAIQHSVEDQRSGFLMCLGIAGSVRRRRKRNLVGASDAETADVVSGDLIEWAVSLFRPVDAMTYPF